MTFLKTREPKITFEWVATPIDGKKSYWVTLSSSDNRWWTPKMSPIIYGVWEDEGVKVFDTAKRFTMNAKDARELKRKVDKLIKRAKNVIELEGRTEVKGVAR